MELTLQEIVFYVVAAAIAVFSVLAVTTGKSYVPPLICFSCCSAPELFMAYWDIPSWVLYS